MLVVRWFVAMLFDKRPKVGVPTFTKGITVSTRGKRQWARPRYGLREFTFAETKHKGLLKVQMKEWLGKKNFKDEYTRNKYYYLPRNHKPNYISPDRERGDPRLEHPIMPKEFIQNNSFSYNNNNRPFPLNETTQSASIISNKLKKLLISDYFNNKNPLRVISNRYGIKLERVIAILRLHKIESVWRKNNRISEDLEKMSKTIYKSLPVIYAPEKLNKQHNATNTYYKNTQRDSLDEIAVPPSLTQIRLGVIDESEKLTPKDAAKELNVKSPYDLLHAQTQSIIDGVNKKEKVVWGNNKKDDRFRYKFLDVKSEDVAHRYGASRDDRKRGRKTVYDSWGRPVFGSQS